MPSILRTIVPGKSIVDALEADVSHELDTSRPAVLYIRRSTETQKDVNLMSLVQQDTKLSEKLLGKGFRQLEKIDTDDGTSGQKLLEDRAGLTYLYDLIEGRKLIGGKRIAAIAAYDASRLWRDTTHVWYNDFIQRVIANNIPVIFYKRTYWPSDRNDMDALRKEFESALATLAQITEKALPARLLAVSENGSYGGHAVPPGYIITGIKTDRHYRPYDEHRVLVVYLFERFKALHGNLSKMVSELQATGFHFPEFTVSNPPHLALPHIKGVGYYVRTRDALAGLLTNKAYIGVYSFTTTEKATYRYDDKLGRRVKTRGKPVASYVNEQSHQPLIDCDLFEYAYSRITGQTLDGVRVKERTERRYGVQTQAVLEGTLKSYNDPVYCMAFNNTYVSRVKDDKGATTGLVVPIAQVDGVFATVMDRVLRHDLQGNGALNARIKAVQTEVAAKCTDCVGRLATIDSAIAGWQMDKESSRAQGYQAGLDTANKQLAELSRQRAALVSMIAHANTDAEEIAELDELLHQTTRGWSKLSFEQKRRRVHLLIAGADISMVTPHIFRLVLTFTVPMPTKAVYFYRKTGIKEEWSDEESAVLSRLYPTADRGAILESLPARTWEGCVRQAHRLGLDRSTRANTSDIPVSMTHADAQLIRSLGLTPATATWPHMVSFASCNEGVHMLI